MVLQVALEGNISKSAIMNGLNWGVRSRGGIIPWLITQQFQDNKFGLLSGARVLRLLRIPITLMSFFLPLCFVLRL